MQYFFFFYQIKLYTILAIVYYFITFLKYNKGVVITRYYVILPIVVNCNALLIAFHYKACRMLYFTIRYYAFLCLLSCINAYFSYLSTFMWCKIYSCDLTVCCTVNMMYVVYYI